MYEWNESPECHEMIITIYCSKGGTGKTPIATNIVLDREYAIGTNETLHDFDSFLPDDRVLPVEMEEEFPTIPADVDIVFDLAGFMSNQAHSIVSAVKQSNLVIVPFHNEAKAINHGIDTIAEINALTPNILAVATKLRKTRKENKRTPWNDTEAFKNIAKRVRAEIDFKVPILPLKESTVFDMLYEREMSIAQLCESDPLAAYNFKDVREQFQAIYNYIDEIDHATKEQRKSA